MSRLVPHLLNCSRAVTDISMNKYAIAAILKMHVLSAIAQVLAAMCRDHGPMGRWPTRPWFRLGRNSDESTKE